MRLSTTPLALILALAAPAALAPAVIAQEKTVEVGGAPMYPSKDIVDNAVNSKDHTTPHGRDPVNLA
jgi:hypothetical protein